MFKGPSGHGNYDGFQQSNPNQNLWAQNFKFNPFPPEFSIRPATIDDLFELQHVARTTFYIAFKHSCSPEDMAEYLEKSFHEEKLKDELQNPLSQYFVITFSNEKIVGYAKLNVGLAQSIEDLVQHDDYVQLQRLYIMPEFQSFKLGTKLMNYLLYYGKYLGYKKCWLTCWDQNDRALAFYHRFGFLELDEKIPFKMGDDIVYDYVMVIDLSTLQLLDQEDIIVEETQVNQEV